MKKFLIIMLATATLAIFGCSSTNSGGYFGYNNKPDYPDTKPAVQNQPAAVTGNSDAGWVNPMDQSNNSIRKLDYVYADYSYQYNPYIYVPVIVPWWNNYHGWVSYPFPGSHFSVYYSNFWGCNWYSPWYVYHPYYGGYWGSHYASGYNHWYHQPVYTHNTRPVDKSTYRSFGENRGTYSNNRVRSTANSSSDRYRTGTAVPGRVESSSQRGSANSAASTGNTYRSTSNTGSSRSNSAVTGGTSSSRNEVKTFKPFDNSSFGSSSTRTNATSTPSRQGSSAESSNTYRTNNNNSSGSERSSGSSSSSSSRGSSASSESERSSSSSSRPSVEPSAPSSSSSSSERSSGSSSGSSSSSGRGSSSGSGSGSGSGRTR